MKVINTLSRASNVIRLWFSQKTALAISLLFGIIYFSISQAESRIRAQFTADKASFGFVDIKQSYSQIDITVFLTDIGITGRDWYLLYLFLEFALSLCACVLASFTISFVAAALVQQQDYSEFLDAKANGTALDVQSLVQQRMGQFRATMLNILPLCVSLVELLENLLLAICCLSFPTKSLFLIILPSITAFKWVIFRTCMSFTLLNFLTVI